MRYRRINIDGNSITETATTVAMIKPGTFVSITDGKFKQAVDATGRLYVANEAWHEGLGIADDIPQGSSAVADYVESGREFAVLTTGTFKKDDPITVGANGQAEKAGDDAVVIGYSQEDVALEGVDLLRIRIK